jgi:hypothetical protein
MVSEAGGLVLSVERATGRIPSRRISPAGPLEMGHRGIVAASNGFVTTC